MKRKVKSELTQAMLDETVEALKGAELSGPELIPDSWGAWHRFVPVLSKDGKTITLTPVTKHSLTKRPHPKPNPVWKTAKQP